jgi:hypothetical protein
MIAAKAGTVGAAHNIQSVALKPEEMYTYHVNTHMDIPANTAANAHVVSVAWLEERTWNMVMRYPVAKHVIATYAYDMYAQNTPVRLGNSADNVVRGLRSVDCALSISYKVVLFCSMLVV